jgi:hypothetical protein
MTITAQAADEPDREQALADIAAALARLGHKPGPAEPGDEVARELAELRKEVAALRASQAIGQHCHGHHCWCSHGHWIIWPQGAAGGYQPVTWTYNSTGTNAVSTATTTNYAASTGGTTYYLPSGS